MTSMPGPMGQMGQQMPPMGQMTYPGGYMPGPGMNGRTRTQPIVPPMQQTQPGPTQAPQDITRSTDFLNGYLRTQIGRKVTVEFLIGTNTLIDKTGTLLSVGTNYILINELESDDILACDFYNIKFVKVFY